MMEVGREIGVWILLVTGSVFCVIGGIGMIRLPDFYTRLHASGITDTGAAYLILAGLMIQGGLTIITVKLAMIGFFMFFTNPTSTYALAAAAHRSGIEPLDAAGGPNKPEPVEKSLPNPIELTPSKTGSAPPSQP